MEISNQTNTNSLANGMPRKDSAEILNKSLQPNPPSYYDDLYDFNDIPLDDPAAMAHMYPHILHNTDEDTDEDINLDYGYGYDYERVIKDRLKAANDAFASDSATPLKKHTKVSFDTTVTAIDEPEVPEIEQNNTDNNKNHFHNGLPEENIPGMNDQHSDNTKTSSTKFALPLNDTVEKENPDDFANKLRAANARYDALTSSLDHTQNSNNNNNNNNNSEDYESQIAPATKKSLNESDSNKTVKFMSTETNNNNNINNNNNNSVNINSTKTADNKKTYNYFMKNSSNSSSASTSPDLNKPKTNQFANILIESNKKDNSRASSTSPNTDDNKSNTTTTVKTNGTSSPLQKTASTSPTSITQPVAKPVESKKVSENSVPTIDDASDKKAKAPQEKTGQKVVLEKDGQFLLVDSDEYTATDKFKPIAEKRDQSADSKKSTPLIPRPPDRPKTSNGRSTNVYTIKPKTTTQEKRVSSANSSINQHVRQSRSADAAGRGRDRNSKSPIEFDRTPEYAQFYKSPYAFPKKKQPYDKNDEQKKKVEQDKEEQRQQENEIAFKCWLEKKMKERQGSKEKPTDKDKDKKERSTSSTRSSTQSRAAMTFDDWLKQKKSIIQEQRQEQQKLRQYEYEDRLPPHTIEERQAVFRDWLRKKYREKHQAKETEKLERKKWASRCRKSRKHQRLSQAIELAQAYGYTSYYYTTGFNY